MGVFPIDGHGVWLAKINYHHRALWADFGADLHASDLASAWTLASTHAQPYFQCERHHGECLHSSLNSSHGVHFLCNIFSTPNLTTDLLDIKRFQRMPPLNQLHPRIRTIETADLKCALLHAKQNAWRISTGENPTFTESMNTTTSMRVLYLLTVWVHG